MNALWNTYIIRTIQKEFDDAYASATAVSHGGEKFDPSRVSEWVDLQILGPRWLPTPSSYRKAEVTISVACLARQSADVHRVDEIAGLVSAALMRKNWVLKDYPVGTPTQVNGAMIRLRETETAHLGTYEGVGNVPVNQANVTVDGTVEITT